MSMLDIKYKMLFLGLSVCLIEAGLIWHLRDQNFDVLRNITKAKNVDLLLPELRRVIVTLNLKHHA